MTKISDLDIFHESTTSLDDLIFVVNDISSGSSDPKTGVFYGIEFTDLLFNYYAFTDRLESIVSDITSSLASEITPVVASVVYDSIASNIDDLTIPTIRDYLDNAIGDTMYYGALVSYSALDDYIGRLVFGSSASLPHDNSGMLADYFLDLSYSSETSQSDYLLMWSYEDGIFYRVQLGDITSGGGGDGLTEENFPSYFSSYFSSLSGHSFSGDYEAEYFMLYDSSSDDVHGYTYRDVVKNSYGALNPYYDSLSDDLNIPIYSYYHDDVTPGYISLGDLKAYITDT